MNVVIRKYEPKDKDTVLKCIEKLQEHERVINPLKKPGKKVADGYLNLLLKECREKEGIIFVADDNGQVVGFSCVWVEEEDDPTSVKEKFGYFSDLYVEPMYRRKGIGTLLVKARKDYILTKDIRRIRVSTLAKNIGIQETLKSQGFVPFEIIWEAEI